MSEKRDDLFGDDSDDEAPPPPPAESGGKDDDSVGELIKDKDGKAHAEAARRRSRRRKRKRRLAPLVSSLMRPMLLRGRVTRRSMRKTLPKRSWARMRSLHVSWWSKDTKKTVKCFLLTPLS